LDAITDWNKIYGKSGFIQYQMVIPKEAGKEGMKQILETIASSGNGSFLAVLKLFGKSNPDAYNSFPFEGYTLALDFKVNSKLKKLVEKLDDIVQQFGGRIYLTKDSMSRSSLTNYLKNIQSSKFVSLQHKRIINNNS
jgi:decaprenylphospho-beta-D-ribofuranose 2-oxidase